MEAISLSDSPASASASVTSRHSDLKILNTLTNSVPNESTVSSIQKNIRDLEIQRQDFDITIKVLTNYLQQLLTNQKLNPPKESSQMDTAHGIKKETISFLPSEENKKTSHIEVKYTISRSGFKTELSIFKGGLAKELLQFLNKFNNAKSKLGYTNCQKLEIGIEQLLQEIAQDEWSRIKVTVQSGTDKPLMHD